MEARKKAMHALLQSTHNACGDPRVLVESFLYKSLHLKFPSAFKRFMTRLHGVVVASDARVMAMLHDVVEFLRLAADAYDMFDRLRIARLTEDPLPDPTQPTWTQLIRDAFVPETMHKEGRPMMGLPTFLAKLERMVNDEGGVLASVQDMFTTKYVRFRLADGVEEIGDILYDIRDLLAELTRFPAVRDRVVRVDRPWLFSTGKAVGGSGPGQQYDVKHQHDYMTGVASVAGLKVDEDAASINSTARILSVYYRVVVELSIVGNRNVRTEYRVRAGLRMSALLVLTVFNITCTFSVGMLFGQAGRLACTSTNLIFATAFLLGHGKYRQDINDVKTMHAYKNPVLNEADIDNVSRVLVVFFLANVFAFIAHNPSKQRGLVGLPTGAPINLAELVDKLLSGNTEPYDMCNMILLKMQVCKSRTAIKHIELKTGYESLLAFLTSRDQPSSGYMQDARNSCHAAIDVLTSIIQDVYSENSYTEDFVAQGLAAPRTATTKTVVTARTRTQRPRARIVDNPLYSAREPDVSATWYNARNNVRPTTAWPDDSNTRSKAAVTARANGTAVTGTRRRLNRRRLG
jgi:hypothetical protein